MERHYFKEDRYGSCLDKCKVKDNGTMIGSVTCQSCEFCKSHQTPCEFTGDVHWIKCSRLKDAKE